ncbi:MAG: hypothetical protein WCP93_01450 [Candidatus Berkelbacteria bacterium]
MHLKLDRADLKEEEIDRSLSTVKFEHLNERAQMAVIAAGSAMIESGNLYEIIYAPKLRFACKDKIFEVETTLSINTIAMVELPDGTTLLITRNTENPFAINHISQVMVEKSTSFLKAKIVT